MKQQRVEYNRWDKGIDLRKSSSVSDANRLRELTNAYITSGWAIRKRPGLKKLSRLAYQTTGLVQVGGRLSTVSRIDIGHISDDVDNLKLVNPNDETQDIKKVHYSEIFNGQAYVIAEFQNGDVQHFYNKLAIIDPKCPQTKSAVKLASRMYAVDGDVVRMSRVDDPTKWDESVSGTIGEGFLPTGLQAPGSNQALGVSEYDGLLAVIMVDSIQLWNVDPDPSAHNLAKIIRNIGTKYPQTVGQYSDDVMFLSNFGFRSISRQQFTDNREDNDIGSAIDEIIRPVLSGLSDDSQIKSVYYPRGGQYWCLIDGSAYVFTYSRSASVNAWSKYTFRDSISDIASLDGELYLRLGDDLFILDEETHTDNGKAYPVKIRTSFQAQKSVGITKLFRAFDIVQSGNSDIRFLTNETDETESTEKIQVEGNSRPNALNGISMVATSVALDIENNNSEEFQLDSLVLYFSKLGAHI